jgi:hypothetical protein
MGVRGDPVIKSLLETRIKSKPVKESKCQNPNVKSMTNDKIAKSRKALMIVIPGPVSQYGVNSSRNPVFSKDYKLSGLRFPTGVTTFFEIIRNDLILTKDI